MAAVPEMDAGSDDSKLFATEMQAMRDLVAASAPPVSTTQADEPAKKKSRRGDEASGAGGNATTPKSMGVPC